MLTIAKLATRRALAAIVPLLVLSAIAVAPTPASSQSAATPIPAAPPVADAVEFAGLIASPGIVTMAELQRPPRETREVTYIAGGVSTTHTYTGVRLIAVLDALSIPGQPETHHPLLRRYVVVSGRDGYQVVLSEGELDPLFANTPVLLAWEEDGAPLSPEDGPVRLIVPGDLRGGRFV